MHATSHPFDDAKARAVAWLTAWDSQGVHRTGTTGDEAGALWLAREAAGLGVDVTTEVFELDRLDPVACYLSSNPIGSDAITWGNLRIEQTSVVEPSQPPAVALHHCPI